MKGFKECLSRCCLFDLGFVGQHFTWCNGRLGDHRTLLRLDHVVANASWSELFQEARVHHCSMSSSDHCFLVLILKNGKPKKLGRKRFLFKAMWVRESGCREVVEGAWDLYRGDADYKTMNRLKNCQVSLQSWNWRVFGNVNQILKKKQDRLQQLENLSKLHENAEEIQGLRKEINEMLVKEIMCSQRSRAFWIKWGDRNTKFFHATASQRRQRNRIGSIQNASEEWQENQEVVEGIILRVF
ncbi:hypothetical protein ACB092_04G081400 [Castanea dentata]